MPRILCFVLIHGATILTPMGSHIPCPRERVIRAIERAELIIKKLFENKPILDLPASMSLTSYLKIAVAGVMCHRFRTRT